MTGKRYPEEFKIAAVRQVTVEGKPYRLAFISADNAATINALQRGLQHYGGQSWLIFDQARAIKKGVWLASVPEIAVSPSQTSKDKN